MAKWLENYNDSKVTLPEGFVGMGNNTKGRDYSPAWGGQFAMGGSVPGAVGFTYARTAGAAPRNGKYAKKTLASAQNGKEMQFYQQGLDWKPKSISKNGSVIKDDRGQWAYPGEITEIGSNDITMQGVDYPVLGVSDTGDTQMMYPDQDYKFDGEKVTEYPMAQNGRHIPTIKEISQMPERKYQPSDAVNATKGVLAGLSMIPLAGYPASIASSVYDFGTGVKYAADGQWDKAGEDIGQGILGLLPTAVLTGIGIKGNKIVKQLRGLKALKTASDLKTISESPEVSQTIYNKTTGRVQEFDKSGNELSNRRPRSTQEVKAYNENLKGQYRTGATSEAPEHLRPTSFIEEKKNGGWLNKYQEGGTLMTNQKVGEKVTPISKLDLRPIIYNYKRTEKDVYDPNCPDGVGCSKQATDVAQSITGLPRVAYAPADAAYRDAVSQRTGLTNIFDQEGEQKKYANSKDAGWKYPTEQDFTNWRAGDIVTLDAGVDRFLPYRAPKGFKYSDNTNTSHNGVITGFTETGRPIITHGYATGKNKGKQITEVLGKDSRVTNLRHGRYAVKSVWRPKEIGASGDIQSIQPVMDTAEERAGRKQATTSNSSFYLKPTEEERLQKDLPVGAEFSGANTRLQTKNKLVDLFNDEKLDDDLQYKLGITAQELDKLKPVVYGVFGQESNFNDVDNAGASFKELIGNLFGNNSRGAAQIKMSSLTADEKKILGIKKASDLDKDEVAYKAALLLLNNSRKRMNREIEQGTHPELANKDEYFRAGYYYNSPARAIQTSEKFTKKKDKKATFSDIKKNELRMDEGSYPYKLMERAKDLGVNIDFDATSDLEPVVVRSVVKNNKGTKFVPKQETGGWLNKYK